MRLVFEQPLHAVVCFFSNAVQTSLKVRAPPVSVRCCHEDRRPVLRHFSESLGSIGPICVPPPPAGRIGMQRGGVNPVAGVAGWLPSGRMSGASAMRLLETTGATLQIIDLSCD
jgi:hypothetical protein